VFPVAVASLRVRVPLEPSRFRISSLRGYAATAWNADRIPTIIGTAFDCLRVASRIMSKDENPGQKCLVHGISPHFQFESYF